MSSVVVNQNIQEWRRKCRDGSITLEEMKQALAAIRVERKEAGAISEASATKKRTAAAKKAPVDTDSLFDELKEL